MSKDQPCRLRLSDRTLEEATYHRSVRSAVDTFNTLARQYKDPTDPLYGALHYVSSMSEKPFQWPDRLLRLTKTGALKQSAV